MRNLLIVLALTVLTVSSTGCSQCRNLFRRGAPCGGTALTAPPMLGAIPLGNPVSLQQAPQIVQPGIIAQPNCCCEQPAPMCCEPCPTQCVPCCPTDGIPCDTGYVGGVTSDCQCQTAPGEYFGGYVEGSGPAVGAPVVPQVSGTYPVPTN